jgi:hypothetical protein
MLCSGFDNDSHSVTLDLLTSEDLEALRQASGVSSGMRTPPVNENPRSKRYLILTYHGEFDKVHYPMALTYNEVEDVGELKRAIVRLRDEVDQLKRSPVSSHSLQELEKLVMSAQSERDAMARELGDYSVENSRLLALVESLKAENHTLRLRIETTSDHRRSGPHFTRHMSHGDSRGSSRASSPVNSRKVGSSPSRIPNRSGVSPRTRPVPGLPPGYQSPYSQHSFTRSPVASTRSPVASTRSGTRSSPKAAISKLSPVHRKSAPVVTSPLRPPPRTSVDSSFSRLPEQISTTPPRNSSLSEVDARLQALQNFLKNQKLRSTISGTGALR